MANPAWQWLRLLACHISRLHDLIFHFSQDASLNLPASEVTKGLQPGQTRRISSVMFANDKLYIPAPGKPSVSDGSMETGGAVMELNFKDKKTVQFDDPLELKLPNPVVGTKKDQTNSD